MLKLFHWEPNANIGKPMLALKEKGVAEIFTPGATTQSIVDWVRAHAGQPAGA